MVTSISQKFVLIVLLFSIVMGLDAQNTATPVFEEPVKLHDSINSSSEEIIPLVSPDGKTMYFSRYLHEENTGGQKAGHDIWLSKRDQEQWGRARKVEEINTKGNDAVIGMSYSGRKIYLLNQHGENQPGISYLFINDLETVGSIEKDSIPFPEQLSHIYGAFIDGMGQQLFVCSKTRDSDVGYDLFLYTRNEGQWLKKELKGINSVSNEYSPYFTRDSILYFASDRSGGKGGMDIYRARALNDELTEWSIPENLEKINSSAYDAYFSVGTDSTAYFVSNRGGGLSDLYSCKTSGESKTPEDSVTIDDYVYERIKIIKHDLETKGVSAPQYVHFDFDSTRITDSAQKVLDAFIEIIDTDSLVSIELKGHTDSIGSKAYNRQLSGQRSKSVRDYLLKNGVEDLRILTIGYGETYPIAPNSDSKGRWKNRRVRMVLHKKKD